MRYRSISTKLIAYYLATATLALLMASFYLTHSLERFYLDRVDEDLAVQARLVAEQVSSLSLDSSEEAALLADRLRLITPARVTLIDPSGRVVADTEHDPSTMDNHGTRPEVIQAMSGSLGHTTRYSDTLGTPMRYVAVPITAEDGRLLGVTRASVALTDLTRMQRIIELRVFGAVAVTCLLVGFGATLLSRSITAPVRRLVSGVAAISRGEYGHQLAISSEDELGDLGRGFNAMSSKLATTIRAMREEKAKSEAILKSMADGVIAVDSHDQVILFNSAAQRIFGRSAASAIGRTLLEAVRNHEIKSQFESTLVEGPLTREITIFSPNQLHLRVSTSPLTGEHAETIGVVGVIQDITELRRLEQVRTDFVANVSHELKTPLTSIKGFTETLLDGAADDADARTEFLQIIYAESERLERLIDDLLDLSKIESGRLQPVMRPTDVRQLTDSVLATLQPAAQAKGIRLANELPVDLPTVPADPDMLRQVLINVVENSIKYTLDGGAVRVSGAAHPGRVQIDIADTGIGIPAEHLPRLFERFYRVDKARSREMGGTGLGLSIVKHIMESHGGEVSIKSEVGKGTIVSLSLRRS